jgi:hypothetical protein
MKLFLARVKKVLSAPVRAFVGWFLVLPFLLILPWYERARSGKPHVENAVRSILYSPVILVRDEKIHRHMRDSPVKAVIVISYFASLASSVLFAFDAFRDYVSTGEVHEVPLVASMLSFAVFACICLITFHDTVRDE